MAVPTKKGLLAARRTRREGHRERLSRNKCNSLLPSHSSGKQLEISSSKSESAETKLCFNDSKSLVLSEWLERSRHLTLAMDIAGSAVSSSGGLRERGSCADTPRRKVSSDGGAMKGMLHGSPPSAVMVVMLACRERTVRTAPRSKSLLASQNLRFVSSKEFCDMSNDRRLGHVNSLWASAIPPSVFSGQNPIWRSVRLG
mmetsp:Transcript_27469/g.56330  ORF Transcript_27469/g.56330 Transcript_27469/m.56330 type:complete len:200 (+) Transcript_27469:640-1239(+)